MNNPLMDFISLDLETTGLNPKKDKIIEIAAVRVRNGQITDTFQKKIDPGRTIEQRITDLTGIENQDVANCDCIENVLQEFIEFLGNDVLVGHRILFDYSFLKKEAVNKGIAFEKEGIDTLKIARKNLPDLESRRLEDLCRFYEIPHHAHRALEDAKAVVALYIIFSDCFFREEDFNPTPLEYRIKKEGPITKAQKERLYRIVEHYKIVPEYQIDRMTKNEASRYTDQILSMHGQSKFS